MEWEVTRASINHGGVRIHNRFAYVTEWAARSIRRIDLATFAVDTVVNAARASTFAVNTVSYLMTSNSGLLAICFGSGGNMFFTSTSAVFQVVSTATASATGTPPLSSEFTATGSPSELGSLSKTLSALSRTQSISQGGNGNNLRDRAGIPISITVGYLPVNFGIPESNTQ
jgi:hypothetical protein